MSNVAGKTYLVAAKDETGEPFNAPSNVTYVFISGDMAGGNVFLERRALDGQWRRYPAMSWDTADAHVVSTLPGSYVRLVVESVGGAGVNVEVAF